MVPIEFIIADISKAAAEQDQDVSCNNLAYLAYINETSVNFITAQLIISSLSLALI